MAGQLSAPLDINFEPANSVQLQLLNAFRTKYREFSSSRNLRTQSLLHCDHEKIQTTSCVHKLAAIFPDRQLSAPTAPTALMLAAWRG